MISNEVKFRNRLVPFFFFIFFFCSYCCGQNAFIKHFTTKDGLPSNNCFYTLQDAKGYIWVASDAGVSRFDGKIFENFSVDDGLPDNQIIKLSQDKSGRIWFSALNGQLSFFYKGKIYNENNNKFLKLLKFSGIVISFFEDSKGNIWFGTNQNILARWDGKSLTKYTSADNSNPYTNAFIYEDSTGKIWAYSQHALRVFDGLKFTLITHIINPVSFKTIANMPNQKMAFLDGKGLNFKNGSQQKLTLRLPEKILNDNPGYFYVPHTNEVWLSSGSGVYHFEGEQKITHYLRHTVTNQVMKDNHNNMWFTTTNGIYQLPKKENRIYITDTSQGLSSNVVKSLVKDENNRLWLGLDNGMINVLNKTGTLVTKIDLPDKSKFQFIKQLSLYPGHNAILFASDNGLGLLKNITAKRYQISYLQEPNHAEFILKSFNISKNDQLAIALSSGVLILNHPLQQLSFNSSAFKAGRIFFSGSAYRVYYDNSQQLWFSNINGLFEQSGNILKRHYQQDALLTKRINDIAQVADGTIVLATDGYGLLFFKHHKLVKQLTQKDGLENNICKKIFVRNGHIWVITNGGINRISNGSYVVESFEYANPLLAGDVNELYIDADTAYFATNHGLVYFPVPPYGSNSGWSKPTSLSAALIGHFWQSDYFILFLILIAIFTFYKIAVSITRQQKIKEQKQLLNRNKILMLEQRALQAMMNPHFVFNIMNSIQHYMNTKDTSSANKILTGFARLIRKNLDICTRSFITLEEEIEYLTLYLNLEKERFGEKFNFKISLDENIDPDEKMVPSMLLQPYIENAIWHGIMPKEEGGEINMNITLAENHSLLIKIIDNGIGITNSQRTKKMGHESKGMNLIQERINLLNQIEANPIQIDIIQNGNSGTIVSILIPAR